MGIDSENYRSRPELKTKIVKDIFYQLHSLAFEKAVQVSFFANKISGWLTIFVGHFGRIQNIPSVIWLDKMSSNR